MKTKLLRSKWLFFIIAIVVLVSVSLVVFRMDFGEKEDAVLEYFSQQEGMPETFAQLKERTPGDSVILCWWDYGRAVREWSHREVVEAYPSRDIWHTVGASRDFWYNLEAQIFGIWGSSERIHDLAKIFMFPEEQSLSLMKKYNISYAVVFIPDELQKFNWIAQIAGFNASEYLIQQDGSYQPTSRGSEVTLVRLLFDDILLPQHFIKTYDNGKGKIYRVDYP